MTDLLVIGGGAAGLMAAGAACAKGLTVTVLEHNPKGPGQKLLITGKGRCNVTSDSDVREFLPYVRHNGRFLYSSLYAFPPASAMQLFEELGVPLKTERGRRVFPQSDRAADVLAALRDYARNAEFVRGSAKKLLLEDGVCKGAVTDRGETLRAENTLIATGGISYPATGSDGSGYKLARQAGHTIVTPQPSLCSLISPDPACRRMMGLALRNVRLTLLCDGKELFTEQGEALFTHFGLSGPLVLSASTYIEDIAKHRYICEFDLKPALDEKTLYDRLTRDFAEQGRPQRPGRAGQAAAQLDAAGGGGKVGRRPRDPRRANYKGAEAGAGAAVQALAGAGHGPGRQGARRGHRRRRGREGSGPQDHGQQAVQWAVLCRRGAGRGRPHRRVQFADRLVHRAGSGKGDVRCGASRTPPPTNCPEVDAGADASIAPLHRTVDKKILFIKGDKNDLCSN